MTLVTILRKSSVGLSSTLLTTFIFLSIALFVFSQISSPEFLKPVLKEVLAQQMGAQGASDLSKPYESLVSECQSSKTEKISIPFEAGKEITLNCSQLIAGGKQGMMDVFIGGVFEDFLMESYNSNLCEGYNCVTKAIDEPDTLKKIQYLMNKNFNDYARNLSLWLAIAAAVCAIIILLAAKGIPGKLLALGLPLAFAGVPYIFLKIGESQIQSLSPVLWPLIKGLMSSLSNLFLAMLVIGIILIAAGLATKIFLNKGTKKIAGLGKD